MGRPKTITDAAVLQATARAIAVHGPVELTLADVGALVGLSPAALIKRFGSKRGLLLALSRTASTGTAARFANLRAATGSPIAALVECTLELARSTRSAEELAHHLAFLQLDMTDPEFRRPMVALARATVTGYEQLLAEAVTRRELRAHDSAALARLLHAVVGGSLIAWAMFRKGSPEAWVQADVEAVLAPYRAARTPGT